MKKTESKFHRFWEQGRNPITMKKTEEDNVLHRLNRSKEQEYELKVYRAKRMAIDFDNQ